MAIKLAEAFVEFNPRGFENVESAVKRLSALIKSLGGSSAKVHVDTAVAQRKQTASTNTLSTATRRNKQAAREAEAAWEALRWESAHVDQAFLRTGAQFRGTAAAFTGFTSRGRQGIFELSRGIEDAAIGYKINGISGIVMSTSNNFARLAEIMAMSNTAATGLAATFMKFAPFLPLAIAIGTAIYVISDGMREAEDATADVNDELQRQIDLLKQRLQLEGRPREFGERLQDAEQSAQTADIVTDKERDIREQQDNIASIQQQLANVQLSKQIQEGELAELEAIVAAGREAEAFMRDTKNPSPDAWAEAMQSVAAMQEAEKWIDATRFEAQVGLPAAEMAHLRELQNAENELARLTTELTQAQQQQLQQTQRENLGQMFHGFGGMMQQFTGGGNRMGETMQELDQQLRESIEDMEERARQHREEQRAARLAAREWKFAQPDRDEDQRRSRQAEFGGISELASRLQERSANRQEQLEREQLTEQRLSRRALENIEESVRGGAIAG